MPRFAATLLLALTALMALLPQAMCPCSTMARASATAAKDAVCASPAGVEKAACCPLCRARERFAKSDTGTQQAPEAPAPCPCCRLNGQGKTLVQLGAVVRPEPLLVVAFALPAPALELRDVAAVAAGREVAPEVLALPPNERRDGVVLLI